LRSSSVLLDRLPAEKLNELGKRIFALMRSQHTGEQ
jgi:hypothetical protein